MSISPTLSADPVTRYTRIDAASDVSAVPIDEISSAVHSSLKDGLRKTDRADGLAWTGSVVMRPSFVA